MHHRDAPLLRHRPRQPFDQLVHLRDHVGLGGAILLGPAIDLAGEIVARLAEVAEADLLRIVAVQLRQHLDLVGEHRAPLVRRQVRQGRIPEHPALLHRHDVEGRPDHGVVHAQRVGARDREALLVKRGDDAVLAVHRMRRRQQLAERLAAQHVGTAGRVEPVGRVRLAALELQDGQRPGIAFDMLAHPRVERNVIDPMTFLDGLGAGKVGVVSYTKTHSELQSMPVSALPARSHTCEAPGARWHDCELHRDRPQDAACGCGRSPWRARPRRRRRRRRTPGSRRR